MKPEFTPTPHELAQSLFEDDPSELTAKIESLPDDPVDLNAIPRDQIADYDAAKILPTHAISRYLASGDRLSDQTIDKMELALETHYRLDAPWAITSFRSGTEAAGDLSVDYFYLLREA
jgi:hypothetical protein